VGQTVLIVECYIPDGSSLKVLVRGGHFVLDCSGGGGRVLHWDGEPLGLAQVKRKVFSGNGRGGKETCSTEGRGA